MLQTDPLSEPFRQAMRRMAATVTILSTRHAGVSHGMTATAVSCVSVSPPAMLASVNQNASLHEPLRRARRFWINLLTDEQAEHCSAFSGRLSGQDRFTCGDWREGNGMPYLADAQANLFCEVAREVPFATHTVFIAEVLEVRQLPDAQPLIYLEGQPCRAPAPAAAP
jgi:flavin reductase (DIM6/NTAB) family NADH-FMN oxidoreductase RutF